MTEVFLKYLKSEKRVSAHTVIAYQNDLEQFQLFIHHNFEGALPADADFSMVRMWIVSLVESGLQPPSVNRKIACLRSFFKFLMRREVIDKDPMTRIRILKTKKKLPSFLKENEISRLPEISNSPDEGLSERAVFERLRDQLMMELFYCTGIRLSELIGLENSKVNMRDQTIKVLGKRNKERVVPFPDSLGVLITTYQKTRDNYIPSLTNDLLIVTEKGTPCYPMLVYRVVKRNLDLITTAEKRSPHVLRHTYATHLLNKGAEINAVKDLLGHSSLAATQVYTHNSMEKLKKVFDQAHPKA